MAQHTWNDELLDAMVRHQIGTLRFSGFVRNRIWKLLDSTEASIREQIATRLRQNIGPSLTLANLQRQEKLLKELRETRVKAWKDISREIFDQLREYAIAEVKFQETIMTTIFPVELGLDIPDPMTLRAIVNKNAFDGETLSSMLTRVRAADIRRIEQGVRMGMVQGDSIPAISRRVLGTISRRGTDGLTEITRRNIDTLVRTAINGVGAAARREFNLANSDLSPQEMFLATLDSRTTPICRSLDGTLYDVGTGPVLPLHPGERSIYTPVVDGEVIGERPIRNFTQRGLVKEFGELHGIEVKVPKGQTLSSGRDAIPHGFKGKYDAFAKKRMRELTGTVPAKTTYTEFLNRQSAQFQDDILGVTRGRLFRSGGLDLTKFVDRKGAEIPLRDLAKFHADAFRAAGLDPADF